MTKIQAAVYRMLKAIGFPVWTGNTTQIPPGGWQGWEPDGGASNAINLATVYGCCRVLCQTIGSVPLHIYREDKSGTREKATDHALYPILHSSPNAYMTSMELREALILSFCLRGNGYAEKTYLNGSDGRITGLNPLRADLMTPKMENSKLIYEYRGENGQTKRYTPEQIIHLKNFSLDGINGITPIREQVIRHAMYTDAYATNFMKNQGRPSGVVETEKPRPKDPDFVEKWRADWAKLFSGDNAGATAYLSDGAKYKAISINPDDAQYIETKKLSSADIAAIFGVPLNMLGQTDKTATYASAEQFDIQFVKHTIRPLAVRLEQVLNKALFAKEPNVYCSLELDGLMRGDSKSQAEYFASMVDHGIMTRNETRRLLNLPVIDYADNLTIQANNVDLDELPKLSTVATSQTAPGDIRKELPAPHIHVSTPMAEEQMSRVVKEITTAAATSKNKKVLLLKTADGTTIGARIIEED